jgi:phospholipid/cholesterol/gamma-HCH transport system substrate-binding protein
MNQSRLEWRVGIFALVALILLGVMILQFSKGMTLFESTYVLKLRTSNVGGIKARAGVLMAGVPIGSVLGTDIDPDGQTVVIRIKIFSRYPIHRGAAFLIEQAGFLGDQYVAIVPGNKETPILQNGDVVVCQEPFNLQEAARSATGLMRRLDQTAETLSRTVQRIDRVLLSEATLTNLTMTIANFRQLSQKGIAVIDGLDTVVQTNRPAVAKSITNLVVFSEQLNRLAEGLQEMITTNRSDITGAIQSFEQVGRQLNTVLDDLQAGKGLAGGVLKDDEMRGQFADTIRQLSILTSNLNKYGLFYKPKPPKTTRGSDGSIGKGRRP